MINRSLLISYSLFFCASLPSIFILKLSFCTLFSAHLLFVFTALLFSGAQGAWLISDSAPVGGDVAPVPLLSSPDLDALCDPVAPTLSASLPRSAAPCSSSLSTSVLVSSLQPQLAVSPSAPPAQSSSCQPGTPANKLDIQPVFISILSNFKDCCLMLFEA